MKSNIIIYNGKWRAQKLDIEFHLVEEEKQLTSTRRTEEGKYQKEWKENVNSMTGTLFVVETIVNSFLNFVSKNCAWNVWMRLNTMMRGCADVWTCLKCVNVWTRLTTYVNN